MEQQLKSELTQQLILEKAFNIFYKNGYESTTVGMVMEASKLSKGAFYHHFTNKKELVLAVIAQQVKRRIYNSMILPLYTDGDVATILKNVFSNRIRSFSEEEKQFGCPANNLINEIGAAESAYQLALRAIIDEWRAALVALIDKGKRTGNIKKEIKSDAVAIYLIGAFEGVRGLRKLYKDDEIFEAYLNGIEIFINQLS